MKLRKKWWAVMGCALALSISSPVQAEEPLTEAGVVTANLPGMDQTVQTQEAQPQFVLHALQQPSMYTYQMMQEDIVTLLSKYPDRFQLSVLGQSVQGRDIYQLIWGNPQAKYAVFVDASIHAREYVNSQLLIALMDTYAMTELGDVCFYIVPMVNPDGATMSQVGAAALNALQASWTIPAFQAEHRGYKSLDHYVNRWKANANGVDLNRNFPYGWEISEQKGYPSSQTFKGAAPASEPETRALMAAVSQRPFELAINYHSMGNLIYYGSVDAAGAVQAQCDYWSFCLSAITGFPRHNSGTSGSMQQGTFADYLIGQHGIPSVTIESGARVCPDNAVEFQEILQHNLPVWQYVIAHFQSLGV